MNAVTKKITIALLALCALLVPASQASAAEAPAWRFDILPISTNFKPGAVQSYTHLPQYFLLVSNVGTAPTKGPVTLTDTVPAGLTVITAYPQRPPSTTRGKVDTAIANSPPARSPRQM
jgi:hypothetical protein